MRISDWSSDVCSSDLTYSLVIDDALIEAVEAHQQHNEEGDSVGDDDAPEERTERAQSSLPVREIQAQLRQEIGRASCRERVCQYGEISVDAVSFKKKKKQHKKRINNKTQQQYKHEQD